MRKITVIGAGLLALALLAAGCASGAADPVATPTPSATAAGESASTDTATSGESDLLELTLEELKQYDGKNGNRAYVAVDGVIYDVTDLAKWKNGEHNGYSAGQDLTDIIKNKSPHGVKKLEGVPVVGTLVDG